MKNNCFSLGAIFFGLLLLNSCSRPENATSTIRIQMPSMPAISSKSSGSPLVDRLLAKSGDIKTLKLATTPTGLTGAYPINCYMVAIGGPSADLQRNRVWRQDGTQPELKIGEWVGGVPAGATIEIETSAGADRVVRLFGLYTNPTYCRNFKAPGGHDDDNVTNPYLLGEVSGITVEAGSSKAITITRTWDAAKYYDKFAGPDFDAAGNTGSSGPYLRLEFTTSGSSGSKYSLTKNRCYPVTAKLFTGSGVTYTNPSSNPVSVTLGSYAFGSFYSDTGCSSAQTTTSIAPYGSAGTTFYFKPTSLGDNLQFDSLTLTSDTAYIAPTWTASNNMIQIGKPYLKIMGAPKLPYGANAICATYDAHLYNFEGGDYTAHTSILSFNLANSANYYIGGASCANASTTGFAAGVASGTIPFKIMTAGSYDFGTIVTDPSTNFDVQTFTVQSGSGKTYADAFDLDLLGKNVELGKCTTAKLRLVNWDRAMAVATGPIEAYIRPVIQGSGMIYTDASCSTPTESISFTSGDSEKTFYFMAYGYAASIDLFISSIKYRLFGVATSLPSVITVATSTPSDPWFIRMKAPSFNQASIVGTHEFDESQAYLYIPFTVGDGFTALDYSPDGGSSWSSIPGSQLSGSGTSYIYKWSAADATSTATRTIRVSYSGGTRTVRISARDLYGPNFSFMNCTAVATTPLSLAVLNTTYSANAVTCLPSGASYTRSSASETYQMTNGYSLIGHSDRTSVISGNLYLGNGLITAPASMSLNSRIANVTLTNLSTGSAGIYVSGTGTTGSILTISNVTTDLLNNQAGNYGILIKSSTGGSSLTINVEKHKAMINGSGAIGLYYQDSSSILNVKGSSYSTRADQSIGMKVYANTAAPSNLNISGNSFEGNGIGLFATGPNNSYVVTPNISQNGFKITSDYGAGTSNTVAMLLNGRISGSPQILENVFYSMATPHRALVEISTLSGVTSPMGIALQGNTFAESQTGGRAIYNDSVTGSGVSITQGDHNSFAFLGPSAGTATAIQSDSGISSFTITSSETTRTGVCGASVYWNSLVNGSGVSAALSTYFGSLTQGLGNVSPNSYRCKDP